MSKKAKTKKNRRTGVLYRAFPRHLLAEIRSYGFSFQPKKIVSVYLGVIAAMLLTGRVLKLDLPFAIIVAVFGAIFAPSVIANSYQNKYEKARFVDVGVYIEQMLYAFKNSQKILTSLEDVSILFPEGEMKEVITTAIGIIKNPRSAKSTENVDEKALAFIESVYPNKYVKDLHRFMLKVERIGGNFDGSIDLLLKSRSMWESRVEKIVARRVNKKTEITISCIASLFLCAMMLYILPGDVDISESILVQIGNTVATIGVFFIYVRADKGLAVNLVDDKKVKDDKEIIKSYLKYINYDSESEFKTSLKFIIIPIILMGLGYFFEIKGLLIAGGVLAPLMLFQHELGHKVLGKSLKTQIELAFPQWLMEIALLLQADNVQVSIFKTVDNSPAVMRVELIKLRDALHKNPDSAQPFLDFFSAFDMPNITTSMQMLYSLYVGSGGDSQTQINNIIERNNIALDYAEQKADDNSLGGLQILFMLPILVVTVAMLIDMVVFLMMFFDNMGASGFF